MAAAAHLRADTAVCVGAGMCVLTAPEAFDQDDEHGTVVVRDGHPAGDDLVRVRRAVELCPSGALSLRDDGGAVTAARDCDGAT